MTAYSEEISVINFSQGMYTADLASSIPDGYCADCKNAIPTGTSVESRFGLKSSSVNFNESHTVDQFPTGFTNFGYTGSEDSPMIIWGSALGSGNPKINMIREGDPLTDPGGSGVITDAAIPEDFYSAVNYNGTYYLFLADGVYKLSNINWTAGTFSTVLVANSPVGDVQSIHFFDRLWTAKGSKIFWTDAISSPGGLPDTWDLTNNFAVIVGKNGPAKIYKLIPLGSRIFIFTSQGLFALTITGSPSDWYSRPLDDNAIVNSYECAFEVGGLIYFISIYGVFVTNGSDSIKLSGPIENYFLAGNFEQGVVSPSKRANVYRLNYMDGGLLASVSNYFIDGGSAYYDVDFCHTFYTRLSNTAWSEWQFNTNSGETKLAGIQIIADSIASYINKSPLSYIMTIQTDSQESGVSRNSVRELMIYDGLRDEWINPVGSSSVSQANIQTEVRTQYFSSQSPNDFKTLKYGFLQMYISDKTKYNDNNYWTYSWDTDANLYDEATSVLKLDPSNIWPQEFTSVKVASDFIFRIAQFRLILNTQNEVNFKIKELYLVQHTERDGPFAIQ